MIGKAILFLATGSGAGMMADVPSNAMLGAWAAANGTVLTVSADGGAFSGRYRIEFHPAKAKPLSFEGLAHLDAIHFSRDGRTNIIRLEAGKNGCITIGANERYCRRS